MAEHKKIDNHTLGIAAISLSKCLVSARIPFALMGGYELVLLGSNRTSKDLDVEIDASRVTFDQVIAAFEADPEFRFIPGNRRDAVSFEEKKPSFHSLQPLWLLYRSVSFGRYESVSTSFFVQADSHPNYSTFKS